MLFAEALAKLEPATATYLAAIPVEHWAEHVFLYPQYGHDTSNISESLK
jgi:hypothetical protein